MRRYFFISYADRQDSPWVARFHTDLVVELRRQTGAPIDGPVDLQPVEAAATVPCMVALISNRYFTDVTCGRQWSVFTARIRLDEARRSARANQCLIPVLWRPFGHPPSTVELPPGSLVGEEGLPDGRGVYELMRTRDREGDQYVAAVRAIAARVAGNQERQLSPWPMGAVELVVPAFGEPVDASSAPQPPLPVRVAISYVRADQPWADWLRDLLHQVGYEVVLAEQRSADHPPVHRIAEARSMADRVVAILSRNFLRSAQPGADWMAALGDNPENRGTLVRVQVDDDPALPSSLPAVSLYGLHQSAIDQLLRTVFSP